MGQCEWACIATSRTDGRTADGGCLLGAAIPSADLLPPDPPRRALRADPELHAVPVSVDTFYSSVAARAVERGADVVNDVSGGAHDPGMLPAVAALRVPYVLMHSYSRGRDMTAGTGTLDSEPDICRRVADDLSAAGEPPSDPFLLLQLQGEDRLHTRRARRPA